MTQHERKKKNINWRDTLLVLNVQNQYKDIAHTIEKKMKKILHYVRTDFYLLTLLANKKNTLNKAKEDFKSVFDLKSQESSCCIF